MQAAVKKAEYFSTYSIEANIEGSFIQNITVDLIGNVVGSNNYSVKLGEAQLQIASYTSLPTNLSDYVRSIYESMNQPKEPIDSLLLAIQFIDPDEFEHIEKFAILHHLEIFKDYRNKQLSNVFLGLISQVLKDQLEVELLLLQVFPVGMDPNDLEVVQKEKRRLEKMYAQAGFSFVQKPRLALKNYGLEVHYMYRRLDPNG